MSPGDHDQTRPPAARRNWAGKVWIIRASALAVGGLFGALAWRSIEPAPRPRHLAPAESKLAHIALNVKQEGPLLHLEWDRNAAALESATIATLHITDGNHQTDLNLTPNDLSAGAISYQPDARNVRFRLEVFGVNRHSDDAIQVDAGAPLAAKQASPAMQQPGLTLHAWRKATPNDRQWAESEADTASRSAAGTAAPPAAVPLEAVPAAAKARATATPAPAAPPVGAPEPDRSPAARVEVSTELAPSSRWSRVERHIPLLRRLKKSPQASVPPQPVHTEQPALSLAEQRSLTTEVPIDVRVYITESGRVDFAELLDTRSADRHRDLASAAVFAARRWDFRPARLGEADVPSQAILHFRFKPVN